MENIILTCILSYMIGSTYSQNQHPVQISKNGHIVVTAKVNGVEGKFILDTGAGLHVVSGNFYSKISAPSDSTFYTGFRHTGEPLRGMIYRFNSIEMGAFSEGSPWIGVYEGFNDMGFDGLISCKIFENEAIFFDLENGFISSVSPAESITEIPLLKHDDRDVILDVFFKIKVADKYDAIVEFDTGAGYSPFLLNTRYMKYENLDTTKLVITNRNTGFGLTEKTYLDSTKKMKINIPNGPAGGFPNIVYKPSLIYDGLVNHLILESPRWTLDIPNARIVVHE